MLPSGGLVDRRFNRARYDADEAVTAFAARLQDAVDLDAVRDDLTGVVTRSLEPAHLSVWFSLRSLFQNHKSGPANLCCPAISGSFWRVFAAWPVANASGFKAKRLIVGSAPGCAV